MNVAKNGTLTFAGGFEQGKRVCFRKDADNAGAKGPDAAAGGVFFAALEDNGHVCAYVLNKDETVVQIADIDGTIACESV